MLAISILHKLALSAWFVHCPENASVVLETKRTLIEVCDTIVDVVKPFTPQISFFCIFSLFVFASLSHMFFFPRCSVECIHSPGTRITKSIVAMLVYLTKDDYNSFVKQH